MAKKVEEKEVKVEEKKEKKAPKVKEEERNPYYD